MIRPHIILRKTIHGILKTERFGVLTTGGVANPSPHLIAQTAIAKNTEIIFVTPRHTHKYENMCRQKKVSLL